MTYSEISNQTIAELAPKIEAREISPVEVTEAALTQADRLQPKLNSFITILHEAARSQAKELEAALMRGEYRVRYTASLLVSRIIWQPRAFAPPLAPRCSPATSSPTERPCQIA